MEHFIVSARKYRPASFDTVVGQSSITTTLKNAISGKHLAHAYLFCGPRGVGKTTSARIFAKTINCTNLSENLEACNKCESCMGFNENRSYNIHELDAASNNSVEDIRIIIDQVRIPPQIGKYSIYIIDEVHMLSTAAFNAFLKTLEEPPKHAIFILATTEKHKILPTILSRCQIFDFNRMSVENTVKHLEYVAQSEGITAEADGLNVIAQKADGAMRDALSIFDQIVSFCGKNITYKSVIDNLNVLDYDYYFRIVESFLTGNYPQTLLMFNDILNHGFDGHHFITGLSSHFRDLLVCTDASTVELLEVGANIKENYKKQAQQCSAEFLFQALNITNTCDLNYKNSRNQRLLVELTLLNLCNICKKISSTKQENTHKAEEKEAIYNTKQVTNEQKPEIKQYTTSQETTQITIQNTINQVNTNSLTNTGNTEAKQVLSLKGLLNQITNKETPQSKNEQSAPLNKENEVIEQSSDFSYPELKKAWLQYAESIKTDKPRLFGTLVSSIPELKENFQLVLSLENTMLEEQIRNQKPEIISYLCKLLKNTKIELVTQIVEKKQQKILTEKEKFEILNQKNPKLSQLKQQFNLEFGS